MSFWTLVLRKRDFLRQFHVETQTCADAETSTQHVIRGRKWEAVPTLRAKVAVSFVSLLFHLCVVSRGQRDNKSELAKITVGSSVPEDTSKYHAHDDVTHKMTLTPHPDYEQKKRLTDFPIVARSLSRTDKNRAMNQPLTSTQFLYRGEILDLSTASCGPVGRGHARRAQLPTVRSQEGVIVIRFAHEASMDFWTTSTPETVSVVDALPNICAFL